MSVDTRVLKTASHSSGILGASAKEVWKLPVLWGRVAKYVLGIAEEKWRAKGWALPFGGQNDNECVLRGMMWADNCWLFSDKREGLIFRVNDTIEELLDLDMEPKPESLWWTNTYKDVEKTPLRVDSRNRASDLPFCGSLRCARIPFSSGREGIRHVYSIVLNGSIDWRWSGATINKLRS